MTRNYRAELRERGFPDGVPGRPALPRVYDRLCDLSAAMGDAERLAFGLAVGLVHDPDAPPELTDANIKALVGKGYRKPTCDPDAAITAAALWHRLKAGEKAEFMAFASLIPR